MTAKYCAKLERTSHPIFKDIYVRTIRFEEHVHDTINVLRKLTICTYFSTRQLKSKIAHAAIAND